MPDWLSDFAPCMGVKSHQEFGLTRGYRITFPQNGFDDLFAVYVGAVRTVAVTDAATFLAVINFKMPRRNGIVIGKRDVRLLGSADGAGVTPSHPDFAAFVGAMLQLEYHVHALAPAGRHISGWPRHSYLE